MIVSDVGIVKHVQRTFKLCELKLMCDINPTRHFHVL